MRKFSKIKGISDIRRIPRRGKLYLGEKKTSGKGVEYPSETEYFVCPEEVKAVCGPEPTELDIVFPSEELDEVFPQKFTYWKTSGSYCRGDGEEAERLIESTKDGERVYKDYPCKGEKCEDFGPRKCKYYANLMILIPKVSIDGVYQIDTSSFHSIVNINSALAHIKKIFGRISNLVDIRFYQPLLVLRRIKQETHGGNQKSIHYVMTIGIKPSATELLEMREHVNDHLLSLPNTDIENVVIETPETENDDYPAPGHSAGTETESPKLPDDDDYDPADDNAQRLDLEIALNELLNSHFDKNSKNKKDFLAKFGGEIVDDLTLENLKKAYDKIKLIFNSQKT